MAMKRKFEVDAESDATTTRPKQLKLVPFPNYEPDLDSAMSEAEPLYSAHHVRIPSNASTTSSDSSYGVPSPENASYPSFDLYPHPFFRPDGSIDTESHNYAYYSAQQNSTVGLLQPSNNFVHHGFPNSVSPVPQDSMEHVQCGASANSAAQFPWSTTMISSSRYICKRRSDQCLFDI